MAGRGGGVLAALVAAVVGAGCASARPAGGPPGAAVPLEAALAASIDSIVDAPPLHRTSWGILITDAASGAVLHARNPDRHFIPASNMKLVVTAAALGRLGPGYRYRTELRAPPATAGAVARLVVSGSGDPTFSARFHGTVRAPFDSLAARVAGAGIRQVAELVVDVSRFRDERVHPTWEVSDLPTLYAPPVDAFAAAEGTFRLALAGGSAPGTAGTAEVLPPLFQPVRATVTTDTAGAPTSVTTDYTARRDTIYLDARVAAGASDTLTLAATQPAELAAAALADALAARGVAVAGVRVTRDTAAARAAAEGTVVVGMLESPPMAAIVEGILRPSQNWMAEQVSKTLGLELAGEGSWAAGQAAQRAYLVDAVGIDSAAVLLRDASGMSAQNLLTPAAAVAILGHVAGRPWGQAYRQSMAQPNLAGSTMAARLQELEGRVFAKTGTITNVNSLSGWFLAADGREYLFSLMSNGSGLPAATVRAALDDIVRAMARHLDRRQL